MNKAKMKYILSNGELVSIGDKVYIETNRSENYKGNIIDIGETYITIKQMDDFDFDAYFSELKDVRIIK